MSTSPTRMGITLRANLIFGMLTCLLIMSGQAYADRWDGYNDPSMMGDYEYNYQRLPKMAILKDKPWDETYWQTNKGGINIRWNQAVPIGFDYSAPTKAELMKMSKDQIATLSASEKYDIFMGRYDFPLWKEVYANGAGARGVPDWSGICDGWVTAAVQYKEPQNIEVMNKDGIMIPFGSSDIKGLMAYAAAAHFEIETRQVGSRCEKRGGANNRRACRDINPGAMHVIVANQIGLKKQAFAFDRDPGHEIWNQPVYGYRFNYLSSNRRGVDVDTEIYYTDELDNSEFFPVTGTPKYQEGVLHMTYSLDLDSDGNIIGGTYHRGSDHPDFAWIPVNHLEFKDYMAGINQIYRPITSDPGLPPTRSEAHPASHY